MDFVSAQLSAKILNEIFSVEPPKEQNEPSSSSTSKVLSSVLGRLSRSAGGSKKKQNAASAKPTASKSSAEEKKKNARPAANDPEGSRPSKAPKLSYTDEKLHKTDDENVFRNGETVAELMGRLLKDAHDDKPAQSDHLEGRLGPTVVKYDVGEYIGSFVITNDRLGVNCQSSFGSVRANVCVFKGKWHYELQLGSKGVMQLGWSTVSTKFSQEKGVGDTLCSYAYDGNRMRKWNQTTSPYGEVWQNGDIIGCCIDLDEGNIEYYRNGKSLGIAFSDIKRGAGIAYFPAASLASNENIVANFGATPLQYPVAGYLPIQIQRSTENAKTALMMTWLEKVARLLSKSTPMARAVDALGSMDDSFQEHHTLMVVMNRIFEILGPTLQSPFVVEQHVLPLVAKCLGLPDKSDESLGASKSVVTNTKYLHLLLDSMWMFLEEPEMKSFLERLCIVLLNTFRSNPQSLKYPMQRYSLQCLIALCQHRKTRRHFLHSLFFDKCNRLMHFLHVRSVDDKVLKDLMPNGWYPDKAESEPASKSVYDTAVELMTEKVKMLEALQMDLLLLLLDNSDGTDKRPSSRAIFLKKLRLYIRDNIRPGSVLQQTVNKALCSFFRLLQIVRILHDKENASSDKPTLPDIPFDMFFDTTVQYHEMERVGGIYSYLYKQHHVEVARAMNIPDYYTPPTARQPQEPGQSTPFEVGIRIASRSPEGPSPVASGTIVRIPVPALNQAERLTAGRLAAGILSASATNVGTSRRRLPIIIEHSNSPDQRTATADAALSAVQSSSALSVPRLRNLQRLARHLSASATSSGENTSVERPVAVGLGAIIESGRNGQNLLIPMLTDLRGGIMNPERVFFPGLMGLGNFGHARPPVMPTNPAVAKLGKEFGQMDSATSLRELLDDAIIIFCCGVMKQVDKVVMLQKLVDEYNKAIQRCNDSLRNPEVYPEEKFEIRKSIEIFKQKLDEQSRHLAWVKAAVFTKERQELAYAVLQNILKTVQDGTKRGVLFSFTPEVYVTALVNLTWLLLVHMNPLVPYENLPGIHDVFRQVAEFVAVHFADKRILHAETKDTLTQALSMFICNRVMLTALEDMSSESQTTMIKSILRPYENRAWAQNNWMLVRMWQGNGFGFSYGSSSSSRRSFRAKPVQDEFGISPNMAPTPSPILQSHVSSVLLDDQKLAVAYLNSVLNQMNWAFSEFIGLLQEIQNVASRVESRVSVESRQLKICCTCFELTQALLRVMEMIFSIAGPVLYDFTRESSEPLLNRICMLISQILNRIGSSSGSFALVMNLDIAGLENVTHYPILAAVAGIMVSSMKEELNKTNLSDMPMTRTLLSEPSFQVKSLEFLFGRDQLSDAHGFITFNLEDYVPEDVTELDYAALQATVDHISAWSKKLQSDAVSIDEDDVCTICYAYPKTCTFKPCNHRSCKTCILHHLMNKGECFFCKAAIQQVLTDDGEKLHDITANPAEEEDNVSEITLDDDDEML